MELKYIFGLLLLLTITTRGYQGKWLPVFHCSTKLSLLRFTNANNSFGLFSER